MRILTADKGLAAVFFQPFLDALDRSIHLALHITGIRIASVVKNSFILNDSATVMPAQELGHIIDIFSAKGFISTGPNQNRSMVLVPLVHGIHPVQHHGIPLGSIAGHHCLLRHCASGCRLPGTMRFQVTLPYHIDSQLIAKLIELGRVGIMAGTNGIDIVLLYRNQILPQLSLTDCTTGPGTEFMSVHPPEHDSLSV